MIPSTAEAMSRSEMPRPEPLLPTTIIIVLEYIASPSLLTPLPPHLISSSLAQRHKFLHLTPDSPADYLSWPTDSLNHDQQIATDLLETLQKPFEDQIRTIRYTGDAESAFAHVAISTKDPPGLRLVFEWDLSGNWKFHNLTLMPFPTNSYESIQEVVNYEFLAEPSAPTNDDEERDSYWDAYGFSSDDADEPARSNKLHSESVAEDAYWAQYSAIHGSGDSTIATPHTKNQNLIDQHERIIISYPQQRTLFACDPLAPPSPRNLAHLLANISPRPSSPLFIEDSDTTFDSGSGSGSEASESSQMSPPVHSTNIPPSTDLPSLLPSVDTESSVSDINVTVPAMGRISDESRDALSDTIRSIYRLWKAGRVVVSPTTGGDDEEFLEIVRQALAESSL